MIRIYLLLLVLTFTTEAFSDNPVIKNIGMSDPHIRVFNDTLYLFSGHDSHPDDKIWVMKDWRVFSSTDLVQWKQETIISPRDNYMNNDSKDCWAGDAASRNGMYYFYFSDQKRSVGVMSSIHPGGHYVDALGKPLVKPMHDPTLFVEDDSDKTPYLVYGDKEGSYHIARLNEDMISLAEIPKPIVINGEEWENAPMWMDKNYLFKHNGTYYLSWGRDYATAKNVYGPYNCAGAVGEGHHLNEFAHGSFFWFKGQFYHVWTYYIRPGYKYRECIISYCHFDDQGRIVTDTDFLDRHFDTGVGQYKASWQYIEAEWYSEKSEGIQKKGSRKKGFELTNIQDDSWICFRNMDFGDGIESFSAKVSNVSVNAQIEIRINSIDGPLLGVISLPSIESNNDGLNVSCHLPEVSGVKDVFFKFKGSSDHLFNLNSISFQVPKKEGTHTLL